MGTTPGKPPNLFATREAAALLEREAELELIERLLSEAAEGRGALLLLEGPAGIGKSRLLGFARECAAALGLGVLRARGGELERDFSHGVVRQLFEPRLAASREDERSALLAGAAGLAAPLFAFAEPPDSSTDTSFATLHGLFWLTANLAERTPLLLAVDDLHWCDSPSLRFLSYLARRLDGLAVVVAVAIRTGEPTVDVSVLGELESEPLTTVVHPAPLSLAAVAHLLHSEFESEPAPEFVQAVHTACRGNPLLLHELVRAVLGEAIEPSASGTSRVRELGPETLSRFVLQRIGRLGAPAEALARAVAILGEASDLSLAAALAALDTAQAAAAATALGRVEILRPHGPLRFVHPVLRAAVYAELSDAERELAHERAAKLLAAGGAKPELVAAHLLHVPPKSRHSVVAALREAARRASAQGDAEAAGAYLMRALSEPPDAADRRDVLLELGEAELRSGRPGAIAHLREAHRLLEGQARCVEAALALATALYAEGRLYDAADTLRRTIERLDPGDVALVQRLEAQLIVWARFDARLYTMARERLAAIAGRVIDNSVGGRFLLALLGSELARAGESPQEARELVERALAGGLPFSDESWQAYAVAVQTLVSLDELDAAVRHYTDWLELARRRGSAFSFVHASSFRATAMLRRGDLAEAEADARIALDAALPLAGSGGYSFIFANLAAALAQRGELAEAIRTLGLAGVPDDVPPTYQMALWLDVRARLRIAAGETSQGLADLLRVGERLEALGVRNPSHVAWRSQAALVTLGRGDREEARRLARDEVELARRWGAPRPLGVALRAAGLVEGGVEGVELLGESVDVLAASPARLERAESLLELGAALRRANQRAGARTLLHEALELAARCGAHPLAERAHAELLATGARPRRLLRTGVASLTPSEHRVARMAAEGMTNREIAQALFVTPKTIEMHLSHVYRKLDIQARSQLARALTNHQRDW